jgi:hypothetical protein
VNAMVLMILKSEKELEMRREGRTLPIRDDFVAIIPKPKRRPQKKVPVEAASPVRQSLACDCPASSD